MATSNCWSSGSLVVMFCNHRPGRVMIEKNHCARLLAEAEEVRPGDEDLGVGGRVAEQQEDHGELVEGPDHTEEDDGGATGHAFVLVEFEVAFVEVNRVQIPLS